MIVMNGDTILAPKHKPGPRDNCELIAHLLMTSEQFEPQK